MVCGIDVKEEKYILTFGSCLSIVSLTIVFVLFYYFKIPNLKRHPTTIAIHKCWFEVLFVSQYIWMSFVPDSFFWDATNDDVASSCVVNAAIWPFAWLTQFSLLGGELWFAVLSIDIHLSLTNPFSSHQANAKYYTTFVYSLAILMATILVSMVPIRYGLSTDPMIWVHDQKDKTNNVKIAMFYFYMFIIYLYCGFIAWWSRNQISKGLEDTLRVRKYSVSKQTKYVIGYFIFWTLVFAFEFLNYLKTDFDWNFMSDSDENILRTVSAFLLASRGMWSLGIFLLANWNEIHQHFHTLQLKHQSGANVPYIPKEEQELVQLNIVLQKEIVRFTGLGIQKAAREINVIMEAQNSASRSSLTSNLIFFHSKMPGESVSFVVIDPDVLAKSRDNSTATVGGGVSGAIANVDAGGRLLSFSNKPALVPTYKDPVNPLESSVATGAGVTPRSSLSPLHATSGRTSPQRLSTTNTPFQSQGVAANDLESNLLPESVSPAEASSERDSDKLTDEDIERMQERRGYLPSTAEVNFQLENKQMERQYSNATDTSVRASTLSTRFMNNLSPFSKKKRDNFLFTDYSPKRFAKLRQLSNITMRDYMESFKSTTMPSFSEGKSGAFIYFSCDYKYIVKTTNKREFEKLLQILPEMERYFEEEANAGRKPLITRFFGAHRIVMYDIPLYFVVMQNVLPSVDEKYDLKGSWVNRHGSKKNNNAERARPKKNSASTHESKKQGGTTPLFLDNDLQNCFLLRPDVAKAVTKQIARDIAFMSKFNLMDYSLLIGVRRRNFEILDNQQSGVVGGLEDLSEQNLQSMRGNPFNQDKDGAFHAAVVEGQGTFYIGIIDILQEWNWQKWYERMFKIYVLQKDGNGLSATDPITYRQRFFQRAVLDVLDGVEDITPENVFEDDVVAAVRSTLHSPNQSAAGSRPSPGGQQSTHSSIARMNSERPYDFTDENGPNFSSTHVSGAIGSVTSGGSTVSISEIHSFTSITRSENCSVDGTGSVDGVKYRGTDNRFSVTPIMNKKQ